MKLKWHMPAKILTGLLAAAMCALPQMPQASTMSARPGAINYIEGAAYLDGNPISAQSLGRTFMDSNQVLNTTVGKAEILLTPGVFLRIGDNSAVRMVSPALTNTQVELTRGEAMIEVAQLVKDNNIQILDHGAFVKLDKTGIYRLTADAAPTAAVIEGKADLSFGDKHVELDRGREVIIAGNLKPEKFDTKREDDLYAWSNVRSEYDAGASYAAAKSIVVNNYGGFGYGGFGYGPGWFWDGGWNTWAWMPGAYAYSPFGWGFFGPAYLGYAPLIYAPLHGRGYYGVPVNPAKPGIVRAGIVSPHSAEVARTQAARSYSGSAFRGGGFSSAHSAGFAGGGHFGGSGGHR